MSTYTVTFFKNILSSDGHEFKCRQETICIRHAKNIDRAVEAAKRRFERLRKTPYWELCADTLELAINGDRVQFSSKSQRDRRQNFWRARAKKEGLPALSRSETEGAKNI